MNKAVFFDRDGILTTQRKPPKNAGDIKIREDLPAILDRLQGRGYLLFCVTNQPDISTGKKIEAEILRVNRILNINFLQIAEFLYCKHGWESKCACRKPNPGMIMYLAVKYEVDLSKSWMVGDSWRDIGAGKSAGCKTILLDDDSEQSMYCDPDHIVYDLKELAGIIT